ACRVYDLLDKKEMFVLKSDQGIHQCTSLTSDDQVAIAIGNSVEFWSLSEKTKLRAMRIPEVETPISRIAFSPDNKILSISIWSLEAGLRTWVCESVSGGVIRELRLRDGSRKACVSFLGPDKLAFGTDVGQIEVFDLMMEKICAKLPATS